MLKSMEKSFVVLFVHLKKFLIIFEGYKRADQNVYNVFTFLRPEEENDCDIHRFYRSA